MSFKRKDVWSSSWPRSRYFLQSSQIHTRVCELCLWANTADRGQQPPADWSPQQNIRGCLYLTVDNLAGSDITRTRRLEEKGSNQTSTLLIINHTKLHHRQDGCQIVSPGQYKTSRRKLFKAEWPSSSSPSFLSSRPTLLRTSSTLCSSRWFYLHPHYMQMQHSTAGLHEERRLQLQLRVKFYWVPSYQDTRGHAGHEHHVRGHAVHRSGVWGEEEENPRGRCVGLDILIYLLLYQYPSYLYICTVTRPATHILLYETMKYNHSSPDLRLFINAIHFHCTSECSVSKYQVNH